MAPNMAQNKGINLLKISRRFATKLKNTEF